EGEDEGEGPQNLRGACHAHWLSPDTVLQSCRTFPNADYRRSAPGGACRLWYGLCLGLRAAALASASYSLAAAVSAPGTPGAGIRHHAPQDFCVTPAVAQPSRSG